MCMEKCNFHLNKQAFFVPAALAVGIQFLCSVVFIRNYKERVESRKSCKFDIYPAVQRTLEINAFRVALVCSGLDLVGSYSTVMLLKNYIHHVLSPYYFCA